MSGPECIKEVNVFVVIIVVLWTQDYNAQDN